MTPIEIALTWGEVRLAAEVAIQRQVQNLRRPGAQDRYGAKSEDNGWTIHIEGASGEMAVAKYLGKFWSGSVGNLKADDVGPYQVRTRSKEHYNLILHPEDRDDRIFILVSGRAPTFRLMGWIYARDGKKPEYWKDPAGGRPAFFVPQTSLLAMKDLPPF